MPGTFCFPWWRLGRPRKESLEAPHTDSSVAAVDELGRSTGLERPRAEVEEFVESIVERLDVRMEDLSGRGRSPDVVRARELAATLGVERYGLRVKEIAAVLCKSSEAVSRMVSRGIVKRQDEAGFEQLYEELDRSIAEPPGSETLRS